MIGTNRILKSNVLEIKSRSDVFIISLKDLPDEEKRCCRFSTLYEAK